MWIELCDCWSINDLCFDGFWTEEIYVLVCCFCFFRWYFDGIVYGVVLVFGWALFLLCDGDLIIGLLEVVVCVRKGACCCVLGWDKIVSRLLSIIVWSLLEGGCLVYFDLAYVGKFCIEVKVDCTWVRVGELVIFIVRINGIGNMCALRSLIVVAGGFKIYDLVVMDIFDRDFNVGVFLG